MTDGSCDRFNSLKLPWNYGVRVSSFADIFANLLQAVESSILIERPSNKGCI